jgi:hypothetical protein
LPPSVPSHRDLLRKMIAPGYSVAVGNEKHIRNLLGGPLH